MKKRRLKIQLNKVQTKQKKMNLKRRLLRLNQIPIQLLRRRRVKKVDRELKT